MCWLCVHHNVFVVTGLRRRDDQEEVLAVFLDHDGAFEYVDQVRSDSAFRDAWSTGYNIADVDRVHDT